MRTFSVKKKRGMRKPEIRVSTQLSWKVLLRCPPPLSCWTQRDELIGHVLQPRAEWQLWSCKTCTSISAFYVCRKSVRSLQHSLCLSHITCQSPGLILPPVTLVFFNFLLWLHQSHALIAHYSSFFFCIVVDVKSFLKHHITSLSWFLHFIIMCHKHSWWRYSWSAGQTCSSWIMECMWYLV